MSTLDRLRALVRGTGPAPSPGSSPGLRAARALDSSFPVSESRGPLRELTYEPVDEHGQPLATHRGLPSLDGAAFVEGPLGPSLVIDCVFEAQAWHGRLRIEEAVVTAEDVARLSGEAAGADGRPVLFLDLETTGLSGGAGTVAFLVGCGRFVDGAFETRQFLLPGFAAEKALLAAASAHAADAGAMVTYNGKTFDVPVMETRWAFHRLASPWEDLAHFDMLHMARRLWRSRVDGLGLTGCRLVTLERDLFEVERVGDVAGFDIPGRYFEFIRHGDASLLEPVLHHNRLDLLSLACLTARAARLLRDRHEARTDGEELAGLGRELLRRGDAPAAESCLCRALPDLRSGTAARAEALAGLARLRRRQRRHGEAAPLWLELTRCAGARPGVRQEATEALAIHYEHRDRDLQTAQRWAERARSLPLGGRHRDRLEHRVARLRRKIGEGDSLASGRMLPLE